MGEGENRRFTPTPSPFPILKSGRGGRGVRAFTPTSIMLKKYHYNKKYYH
jgi:hypothetical protein